MVSYKKIEILFYVNMKGTTFPNRNQVSNKMSYSSRKNNSSNFSARKPYCAHCQNTGEPENVYTSHYPRSLPDRTGKTTVTCPKLQSTECTYCYEFGHTRKFCPVIKKNQRAYEMEDRRNKAQELEQKQEKHQKQRNLAGGFAMLAEDDSDNDEQKTKPQVKTVKEEWPALSVATASVATASVALTRTQTIALPTVPPQNVTTGYAAMAAKPARVYSSQEPHTPISEYQVLNKGDRMTKTETPVQKYVPRNQWSWLDDEEEDEEEDW